MAKQYTIKVWEDEELLEDTVSPTTPTIVRYQVADDEGEVLIPSAQVRLINEVSNAGTPVDAAGMNNIEEGVDMLDTIVNQDGVTKIRESEGPTTLDIGAISDGLLLSRSGANIVGAGDWVSYTPTFTNFTLGDGTINSVYMRTGNIVHWYCHVVLGGTSVVSGRVDLSLPVNAAGLLLFGNATFTDAGIGPYPSIVRPVSATTLALYALNASGTYLASSATSATVPFTWSTGDTFAFLYTYRVS